MRLRTPMLFFFILVWTFPLSAKEGASWPQRAKALSGEYTGSIQLENEAIPLAFRILAPDRKLDHERKGLGTIWFVSDVFGKCSGPFYLAQNDEEFDFEAIEVLSLGDLKCEDQTSRGFRLALPVDFLRSVPNATSEGVLYISQGRELGVYNIEVMGPLKAEIQPDN